MRNMLLVTAAIALGSVASGTTAPMQTTQTSPAEAARVFTMKITGMTCSGCEAAVKIAAKKVDGVKNATASYARGIAEVTYDPAKTSPDAIAKAVAQKTGYKVEVTK